MKRKLKRRSLSMLMAGIAGAAFAYYFDPASGERRRVRLSQRVSDVAAGFASARRQLAHAVEVVTVAASGDDPPPPVDTTVTGALEADELLPDIGGVTSPVPDEIESRSGLPTSTDRLA